MTLLSADRQTTRAGFAAVIEDLDLPAGVDIVYRGGMVGKDASGNAVAASSTLAQRVMGVAKGTVDNSAGSAGDKRVAILRGAFYMTNGSSADALTAADIGEPCFVIDDQTVGRTSGTAGTRQVAGRVLNVDSTLGVLVEMLGTEPVSGGTTPTITVTGNTTASTVPVMLFQRVGNVVHFTGRASVSHTAGAPTASTFDVSLPIASLFDAAADAMGTVTGDQVTRGIITANTTDDRLTISYYIGGTGAQVVNFSGSYLVK